MQNQIRNFKLNKKLRTIYVDFLHASIQRMLGNYYNEIANMNRLTDAEVERVRNEFLAKNEKDRICCICDFPIDTTQTDKPNKRFYRNQKVIQFHCENFYIPGVPEISCAL